MASSRRAERILMVSHLYWSQIRFFAALNGMRNQRRAMSGRLEEHREEGGINGCPLLQTWIRFIASFTRRAPLGLLSGQKVQLCFHFSLKKDGDRGQLSLIRHHLYGALLGGLRTTGETVEVQLNGTYNKKRHRFSSRQEKTKVIVDVVRLHT
ncbi:hypothetical protein EYF80_045781 [Liparis tanakae]|uniref:Uncharacterized protein n=1 Tax=Liparis tanakae TaxID=230148 RepID=A0A4Z2FS27_9TELE|nr:hypothetical protein EYF80_045781 [Liparis tanakae]